MITDKRLNGCLSAGFPALDGLAMTLGDPLRQHMTINYQAYQAMDEQFSVQTRVFTSQEVLAESIDYMRSIRPLFYTDRHLPKEDQV